mmetsp:Transcript_25193/g.59412  ORF Transcript_25193/g.59412 Transcript_25193/m.59412 type:complete len:207 (+) Transcript_25193:1274-1894(+)
MFLLRQDGRCPKRFSSQLAMSANPWNRAVSLQPARANHSAASAAVLPPSSFRTMVCLVDISMSASSVAVLASMVLVSSKRISSRPLACSTSDSRDFFRRFRRVCSVVLCCCDDCSVVLCCDCWWWLSSTASPMAVCASCKIRVPDRNSSSRGRAAGTRVHRDPPPDLRGMSRRNSSNPPPPSPPPSRPTNPAANPVISSLSSSASV